MARWYRQARETEGYQEEAMMDRDVCGVGRCRSVPDFGTIWSVPICDPHWHQCCREDIESLRWLHKHAKKEFASKLPPFVPHAPAPKPKPVARMVKPVQAPTKPKARLVRRAPPAR